MNIYVDGAQRKNGQQNQIGGVGVYFGDDDKRNLSEVVENSTNNISELTAIKRALEIYDGDCKIYSDSKYSVRCINEWYKDWLSDPKKMKDKKNLELIKYIYDLIEERRSKGIKIELIHIEGHDKCQDKVHAYGNMMADLLATSIYKNK